MNTLQDETPVVEYDILHPRPPHIMSDDRTLLAWQRSHMANERTFLSWSRTSLGLLAFGFVMERFDIFMKHILVLEGADLMAAPSNTIVYLSFLAFVLAGVMIVISGLRFLSARRHINLGEAKFSILPEFLVITSVVVVVLMTIMLSLPQLKRVIYTM